MTRAGSGDGPLHLPELGTATKAVPELHRLLGRPVRATMV
jgi:hypothetical protein